LQFHACIQNVRKIYVDNPPIQDFNNLLDMDQLSHGLYFWYPL